MTNSSSYNMLHPRARTGDRPTASRSQGNPITTHFRSVLCRLCVCLLMLPAATAASAQSFVPESFEPPRSVDTGDFVLKPLGPELAEIDYEAYMSSIDHLRATFSRSSSWPRENLTMADAFVDMETEKQRFDARTSFAYAVLSPDETIELGCVYVYPSDRSGFDASIRLWVTQEQFDLGFDDELFAWTKIWIADDWPFVKPAFPGRDISWSDWDALEKPL